MKKKNQICRARARRKIEHDFSNKLVLKLTLTKNHFHKNVILNSYSLLKKNRKIRMIFDIENLI